MTMDTGMGWSGAQPRVPRVGAYPQGHRDRSDFAPPARWCRAAVVPRMGRFPAVIRESMTSSLSRMRPSLPTSPLRRRFGVSWG